MIYRRMAGTDAMPVFNRYDAGLHRALPYLIVAATVALFAPNTARLSERFRPRPLWALWGALMFALSMLFILGRVEPPEFLYFDF